MSEISKIKYCTDIELIVLKENCKERKWKDVDCEGKDWNFFWASLPTMKNIFKKPKYALTDHQLINHFPTFNQLSNKNSLFKNIQTYRKKLKSQGSPDALQDEKGNFIHLGFMPMTFSFPEEVEKLKEYFKKNPSVTCIFKPAERSLGIGIFLINKQTQTCSWTKNPKVKRLKNYVASRYIDNPFLLGGFCRFCQVNYSNEPSATNEMFAHLTNVSIQHQGDKYKTLHGGKWEIENLRLYLEGTKGVDVSDKLFKGIHSLIVHSLKAAVPYMTQDPHCFECYGYDILISDDLKPWLIEVNALPSLVPTTEKDRIMKYSLMSDILNIMCPGNRVPDIKQRLKLPEDDNLGNFELIYNEGF